MKTSSCWLTPARAVGAVLLCLLPHATGHAQSYAMRPTCNPSGQCQVNPATFGFNDTNWRSWPVQARPEQRNSKAVGSIVLPTPPPIPEKRLPEAEELPKKPPLSNENGGGLILPGPGLTPGATATPELKLDGGPTMGPAGKPAGQGPQMPAPQGLLGIPVPSLQEPSPKAEDNGPSPLTPPKELLLPGGFAPDPLTPIPGTAPQSPRGEDKNAPATKSTNPSSGGTPSLDLKPDKPLPDKGSSHSRPRNNGIAAVHKELPMQADWNAALEPETVGGNPLRNASFEDSGTERNNAPSQIGGHLRDARDEHSVAEIGNPLRSAMDGFCPVELKENDRWIIGSRDIEMPYQGQVFHFSSDAARKRFESAPEHYAPAQSGNDIVLAVEENRSVPGNVNHSAVWHGRLYLFSNSETLSTFQADPTRYVVKDPRETLLQIPANSL